MQQGFERRPGHDLDKRPHRRKPHQRLLDMLCWDRYSTAEILRFILRIITAFKRYKSVQCLQGICVGSEDGCREGMLLQRLRVFRHAYSGVTRMTDVSSECRLLNSSTLLGVESFLKETSAIVRAICRCLSPPHAKFKAGGTTRAEATLLRSQHLGLGRGRFTDMFVPALVRLSTLSLGQGPIGGLGWAGRVSQRATRYLSLLSAKPVPSRLSHLLTDHTHTDNREFRAVDLCLAFHRTLLNTGLPSLPLCLALCLPCLLCVADLAEREGCWQSI
ncbi:hypothetical protein QBC41DRAFT_108537 [Cercophora samala]|uniref:Uncharacterized protein n=1 Tax=Cercophora samala TaxID=330535 RepID=A0AA39ZEM7_9PEZI|nr:hypothetical protein QBC41DRAFT_108537 [Cercophora samala]